jgi:LPS-assembly protein
MTCNAESSFFCLTASLQAFCVVVAFCAAAFNDPAKASVQEDTELKPQKKVQNEETQQTDWKEAEGGAKDKDGNGDKIFSIDSMILKREVRPNFPNMPLEKLLANPNADDYPTGDDFILIADEVRYDKEKNTIAANSNTRIFYRDHFLRGSNLYYDMEAGKITADKPMILFDRRGEYFTVLQSADFDKNFQQAFVKGVFVYINNNHARFNAETAEYKKGGKSTLTNTWYTTCRACKGKNLWQLHGKKIVYDAEKKDIIVHKAKFEFLGMTIAYWPYISFASPEVKQRSGFLFPDFNYADNYGVKTSIPYYYTINPSKDVTIIPHIMSKGAALLETQYRSKGHTGEHRFTTLNVLHTVSGVGSNPGPGVLHGYYTTNGRIRPTERAEIRWDLKHVTHRDILHFYKLSNEDFLRNDVNLSTQLFSDWDVSVLIRYYQSLLGTEEGEKQISFLPKLTVEKVWDQSETFYGGQITFTSNSAYYHYKESKKGWGSSINAVQWDRDIYLNMGLKITPYARLRTANTSYDRNHQFFLLPDSGITATYPLVQTGSLGTGIFTPKITGIIAGGASRAIYNADFLKNQGHDFTILSISDLNRGGFAQFDHGSRIEMAASYEWLSGDSWKFRAEAGQIFRYNDSTIFSRNSGLRSRISDKVVNLRMSNDIFSLSHKFRINSDWNTENHIINSALQIKNVNASVAYYGINVDPYAERFEESEFIGTTVDWAINSYLSAEFAVDYSIKDDTFRSKSAGLHFHNECLDFSVSAEHSHKDGWSYNVKFRLLGW